MKPNGVRHANGSVRADEVGGAFWAGILVRDASGARTRNDDDRRREGEDEHEKEAPRTHADCHASRPVRRRQRLLGHCQEDELRHADRLCDAFALDARLDRRALPARGSFDR